MANRVVMALLSRSGTATRKTKSASASASRPSRAFNKAGNLYIHHDVRTSQSLFDISPLPTKITTNFSTISSITTGFSSSFQKNFFGSGSGSQEYSQSLKMLRGDLETLSNKSGRNAAAGKATGILQKIIQGYGDEVTVRDCNMVIRNQKDSPTQALNLLKQMITLYEWNGNESVRPTVATYNFVIEAFAQKGDIKGSRIVFNMQVSDFRKKQNVKAKPNLTTFRHMIYACSKSRANDAPKIAKEFLSIIINWHEKRELKQGPNAAIYITTMNACARNGDVDGATSVLQMMENDAKNVPHVPHLRAYSILINAWSKSGLDDAPCQAESILNELSNMFVSGSIEEGPDTIMYCSVMDTYAAHGDVQGAYNILEKMEYDYNSGNNDAKPNMRTYSALINAWAKSGQDDAPNKARSLLNKVIDLHSTGDLDERPNAITYSSVMNAYANKGDVQGAMTILEMMEKDFKTGNDNARPDMQTYSTLINAWSKSSDDDAPNQATNLLNKMISLYSNKSLNEGPNTITYSSVMDAYAAHGDVQGAMTILEMMEKDFKAGNKNARPNIRTYSILINAWSKSNMTDAPKKAAKILKKMIDLYSKGGLKQGPDVISYSSVMDAYATKGDVEGANGILEMMRSDSSNIKSDTRSYNTLIKAWAKSNRKEARKEVEKILQEINDLHKSSILKEGPSTATYSSMIECIQKFEGTKDRVRELESLKKSTKFR